MRPEDYNEAQAEVDDGCECGKVHYRLTLPVLFVHGFS
jgi:hypothetical protein